MKKTSPKKLVSNAVAMTDRQKQQALKIKTQSTVNGAFWGGAFGLLYGMYKGHNKYLSALIGLTFGAIVSNTLTVNKSDN